MPTIVMDGSGGAIIAWADPRSGGYDIYAQLIDSAGNTMWAVDGVALCTATGTQIAPCIASDGAGGAIVAWQDQRSDAGDIYAQQVDASGTIQWTADGVALCTAAGIQGSSKIVPDGAGGAIVAWYDARGGSSDLYAQRINVSGEVQWATDGVALCTATEGQDNPIIVSDGSGGAIVTWQDYRSGSHYDIYAQRIDASGTVQWTIDGVAVCAASLDQNWPKIISDGDGGAIITWQDSRSGVANKDIYAQRVGASGAVRWTTNGDALCTATGSQTGPEIVQDGSGGAIVTWNDYRSGAFDIYAQRIDAEAAVEWATNGVALCTATGGQLYITAVSDGGGGAIVAWLDKRSGNYHIYAQLVDFLGAVQWTTDGVPLCTYTVDEYSPTTVVSDGAGGAITVWRDFRNDPETGADIFAQRVTHLGNIGADPVPIPASANLVIVLAVGSLGAGWLWKRRTMHH